MTTITIPESERRLCGSVIEYNKGMLTLENELGLKPTDFQDSKHRQIYTTMRDLYFVQKREKVDLVILTDELESKGLLGSCGGYQYVEQCAYDGLPEGYAVEYARTVIENGRKMNAASLLRKHAEMLEKSDGSQSTLNNTISQLQGMSLGAEKTKVVNIADRMPDYMNLIEDRISRKEIPGLKIGIDCIDNATYGFRRGDVIAIGAYPGVGKTTLAMNMGINAASQCHNVFFASLEMSENDLLDRITARQARINSRKITHGNLSSDEKKKCFAECKFWETHPHFFILSETYDLDTIKNEIRYHNHMSKIDLVIIDYVTLIQSPAFRGLTTTDKISKTSNEIKSLAITENVPVIAIASLRKPEHGKEDKMPSMYDIKDSAQVAYDASTVIMLQAGGKNDEIRFRIEKSRHGIPFTSGLKFEGQYSNIYDDLDISSRSGNGEQDQRNLEFASKSNESDDLDDNFL